MRIIGYIEHPSLKITVFKMDNKLSVKFESGLYEQTYKFRSGEGLDQLEQMQKLVDTQMIENVAQQLNVMHKIKNEAKQRFLPPTTEDEFDEII